MKKCKMCAEEIQDEAIKCKHCGHYVNEDKISETEVERVETSKGIARGLLSFIIPGLGQFANGEVGLGLAFLLMAIVVGVFTFGIGGILVAIVAALMCKPKYACGKCGAELSGNLKICPNCKSIIVVKSKNEKINIPLIAAIVIVVLLIVWFV